VSFRFSDREISERETKMTMATVYGVQCFNAGNRGRIVKGPTYPARDAPHAVRYAERLKEKYAGVIAFSQASDVEAGDYDDLQILASHGIVPEAE
jgi:hypothetical protein